MTDATISRVLHVFHAYYFISITHSFHDCTILCSNYIFTCPVSIVQCPWAHYISITNYIVSLYCQIKLMHRAAGQSKFWPLNTRIVHHTNTKKPNRQKKECRKRIWKQNKQISSAQLKIPNARKKTIANYIRFFFWRTKYCLNVSLNVDELYTTTKKI